MDKVKLLKLKNLYGVLNNVNRLKIISLCEKDGLTITQLSRKLNLNYNITSEYVGALRKVGLVKRIRNPDRIVTVYSLVRIKDNGGIVEI